jgi:hypothetical protein
MCGRILPILLVKGAAIAPPLVSRPRRTEPPKRNDVAGGLRPNRVASSAVSVEVGRVRRDARSPPPPGRPAEDTRPLLNGVCRSPSCPSGDRAASPLQNPLPLHGRPERGGRTSGVLGRFPAHLRPEPGRR